MRPCDIDRSGEVWIYKLSEHKTDWTGRKKAVPLVGDAREAITEYMRRDPKAYLFSPKEAMAWRHAVAAGKRVTPANQGNRPGTNRKQDPKRLPKDRYTTGSYYRAIKRAAEKAGVDHWFPYQLRHLTATVVRAALGLEGGRALLGHSTTLMTAHYAQENIEAAIAAAKSVSPTMASRSWSTFGRTGEAVPFAAAAARKAPATIALQSDASSSFPCGRSPCSSCTRCVESSARSAASKSSGFPGPKGSISRLTACGSFWPPGPSD